MASTGDAPEAGDEFLGTGPPSTAFRLVLDDCPRLEDLRACLSSIRLRSALYARAPSIPTAEAAAGDWAIVPRGPEDLQAWVAGPAGSLAAVVRVESLQLSYFVAPGSRRLGLAHWAVSRVIRAPRLAGKQLHATVSRDNVASRRVLEITGFTYKGLLPTQGDGRPGRAPMLFYERQGG